MPASHHGRQQFPAGLSHSLIHHPDTSLADIEARRVAEDQQLDQRHGDDEETHFQAAQQLPKFLAQQGAQADQAAEQVATHQDNPSRLACAKVMPSSNRRIASRATTSVHNSSGVMPCRKIAFDRVT